MKSVVPKYLKSALEGELPGFGAHCKMLPPGRRLKTSDDEMPHVKQSSVLLLLFPQEDELFICLTKRPSTMTIHPGQISFPGGKVEKEDSSPEMTALREAREEIGIDTSRIQMLGKLSDLYVEVSRFSIQPYLAWSDEKPEFDVNFGEVEKLLFFPLTTFIRDEEIQEVMLDTVTGPLQVKYYPFDGEIIWGATAMILSELIEILRPQLSQSFLQ
jgi:8-oxo-dGTP pyrophosphatase MutT (NUDIX family)